MNKGVYVHVPFCKKKCNYCSFYSVPDLSLTKDFLAAIAREIEYKRQKHPGFFTSGNKATLYIGGGNPAVLSLEETKALFDLLFSLPFSFSEVSMEANPDCITPEQVVYLKNIGVNRLSLGLQSCDDATLRFLGRNHSSEEAFNALEAVSSTFNNYSIDLIGGVPAPFRKTGDSRRHTPMRDVFSEQFWEEERSLIQKYRPPHVSMYLLTIEKGSGFYNSVEIDEKNQESDYRQFCRIMKDEGYEHYEISSFTRAGYTCRHNELYWAREEHMGFGPSAVSFIREDEQQMRIKNVSNVRSYIKVPALSEVETLSRDDIFFESVFLPLRTRNGLDLKALAGKFPEKVSRVEGRLLSLAKDGFVQKTDDHWTIPEQHMIVSNEIILEILKEKDYA